jgi:hypothetical protein
LAISVLKHLQSHHFYCWCKPHIHPYPSWPQEWKQHSTSYKKFRFYPQFLCIFKISFQTSTSEFSSKPIVRFS